MQHPQNPVLEGWKEIADALGLSTRVAIARARRHARPLPVVMNHRNRVEIARHELDAWVAGEKRPYQSSPSNIEDVPAVPEAGHRRRRNKAHRGSAPVRERAGAPC